jgi:hypothetical protein
MKHMQPYFFYTGNEISLKATQVHRKYTRKRLSRRSKL